MSENQLIAKVGAPETNGMSRILVVEDSLIQAHQLAEMLVAEHLEVETAVDAEQGFFLFQTKDFDLVITDILLPGMSGYELCGSNQEYLNQVGCSGHPCDVALRPNGHHQRFGMWREQLHHEAL